MITELWGKKIGMTQLFVEDKVVPVTVIDITPWIVTNHKTKDRDGYDAVQVGQLRKRYNKEAFSIAWLKNLKKYFQHVKEIKTVEKQEFPLGKPLVFDAFVKEGDFVDVAGMTKGAGFAGVVRRHGFTGARASHGATMGKAPGAMSFMRAHGRVIKGKRLPGHMGNERQMMRNLAVVKLHEDNLLLVKGSIPGKSGSLVFIQKA